MFINAFNLVHIFLYLILAISLVAIYIFPHCHSLSCLLLSSIYKSDELLTVYTVTLYILMNHSQINHFLNKQFLSMNIIETIVKRFQNHYNNLQKNCSCGSQLLWSYLKHLKVPYHCLFYLRTLFLLRKSSTLQSLTHHNGHYYTSTIL